MPSDADTTDLVLLAARGDARSEAELVERIYDELRSLARKELVRWEGHGLDSTSLVHELYLRLLRRNKTQWQGRRHLLNAFAQAMHLFMIDMHRRGVLLAANDTALAELETERGGVEVVDLMTLRQGLEDLSAKSTRAANVLRAHYFLGLTVDEIAREFEVSSPTVDRDLAYARAWLHRQLSR